LKILAPIDGSSQSEKALEYAVNLQKQITVDNGKSNDNKSTPKKEIIILSVIPHFHIPLGFEKPMKSVKTGKTISLTDYIQEMNDAIQLEWADRLSDIKKKYESPDMPIRTEILVGGSNSSIAENIIKFSNKENIDLTVIGNVGLGGLSKVKASGSVSRNVSEMSNCPVLIVH
jgi:nucleotide-binding universal stress UspA family protein